MSVSRRRRTTPASVIEDTGRLWLATLEHVAGRAAHEVKDALNGVSVNLEVVRSRCAKPGVEMSGVVPFANSATDQLETLGARVEALLYLSRPPREPADLALTLKHLAALLVPATRADNGVLKVEGHERSCLTAAAGQATRLAVASGMLAAIGHRGSTLCRLECGQEPVVRISHESASCSLDPAVAAAVATHGIRTERSDRDLILVFPGHTSSHGSTH